METFTEGEKIQYQSYIDVVVIFRVLLFWIYVASLIPQNKDSNFSQIIET